MKTHCEWEPEKRDEGLAKIKEEISGVKPDRIMYRHTEIAAPTAGEPRARSRIKKAFIRDMKYGSGNYVYMKSFGLSQAMRENYDAMKACHLGKIANKPIAG